MKNLYSDVRAQDIAEYAIALSVIGVGAIAAALAIGGSVNTIWSNAESVLGIAV
jgi:Flp pilus assembly pilin Flp